MKSSKPCTCVCATAMLYCSCITYNISTLTLHIFAAPARFTIYIYIHIYTFILFSFIHSFFPILFISSFNRKFSRSSSLTLLNNTKAGTNKIRLPTMDGIPTGTYFVP